MDLITDNLNNIDQDEDIENMQNRNDDYIETYKSSFFESNVITPDEIMDSGGSVCIICTTCTVLIGLGAYFIVNYFSK